MPTIFIEASKYALGLIIGAMALIILNWVDTPDEDEIELLLDKRIAQIEALIDKRSITMDEIRAMMDKESPWVKERLLIISRLDSMERADASLSTRIDNILSKLDSMQNKTDSESRNIYNSLSRIMAKLDMIEESKKKDDDALQ